MTITSTDFEVFVQEHPEDPSPCDRAKTWGGRWNIHKGKGASWILRLTPHCGDEHVTVLICDDCKEYALHGRVRCVTCYEAIKASDEIISIEPITKVTN